MKATITEIIFDFVLYIYMLFLSYKGVTLNKSIQRSYYIIVCSILLFCLFAFNGGDYFHYMEQYPNLKRGDASGTEPIYIWIAQNVGTTYFLFRLVIWGSALFALLSTYKLIGIRKNVCIYCFIAISLLSFSYARVSLSMALMFCGFTILSVPHKKHKYISAILGFILILSSYFFHKSALFGIAVIITTLMIGKISRTKIAFILILFPVFIGIVFYLITQLFGFVNDTDMELLISERTLQTYIPDEIEESGKGIAQQLLIILNKVPIYLTFLLYLKVVFNGLIVRVPETGQRFMTAFFLIVIGATVFYFNPGGLHTYTLFYRFLNFSIIPISIVLTYFYINNIERKNVRTIIKIGIVSSFSALLYSGYCAALGV